MFATKFTTCIAQQISNYADRYYSKMKQQPKRGRR